MTFKDLISSGEFIPFYANSDDDKIYLWDDWDKCNELIRKEPNLHIYTIISENERLWVIEGVWRVNRMGYLFSRKYVKIKGDVEY